FEQIGGFDEELANGSDMDFSWRAQLAGYTLGFAPDAVMRRRLPSRARLAARQHYRWGRATPPLYRAFRDAGMGRRTLRTVGKVWADLSLTLPLVPFSARARRRWLLIAALHVGHVVGSRLHRDLAAGEGRLGDADHRVERVPVQRQRVGDEAVVGRIHDRREQEAVELDPAELVVVLVLVAAALGDLDDDRQVLLRHGREII